MRKTILILIALVCCVMMHAQDTVFNRVVTVERDYQPDIQQATKIKLQPVILKEEVEPNPVVYSTYSMPLSVRNNIHPLQAATTQFIPQPTLNGILEGALGHRNTHLLFGYRILQKKKTSLDLYAKHDAQWGKDALSLSLLGMNVSRHFSKADLYFGVNGVNEYFTYYGRNYSGTTILNNDIDQQKIWKMNANIGIRSTGNCAIQYRIQTGYKLYNIANYTLEHQVLSHLDLAWSNDNHGAGINSYVQNNIGYNKHILRIEPFYAYENEQVRLHLGANLDMNVGSGQLLSTVDNLSFAPSPNVKLDWYMLKNNLILYTHAKGSIGTGSTEEYLNYNRYLNIDKGIKYNQPRAYTPIDAQIGFKIRPIKTMLVDLYGGYAYHINAYHMVAKVNYYNQYAAQDFTLELANYQHWKVGTTLHYHYRDIFEINVAGNYYIWKSTDNTPIYDRPAWNAHARLDIHFDSKWSIYSDNSFAGGYKVSTTIGDKTLNPTISLNIGGQYSVNNWLHLYLQLNNYLNRKNDIFYGYKSQGCHFLLGVKYKF